ncbi:MAG: nucleotidyltransferase family protein [Armatimonadota bacterium]
MPKRSSRSVQIFYPRWSREALVAHLTERLPRLATRLPLARAVLFGSYAKGTFTAASDIDLLIVYKGEPRADAYASVRRTLEVPRLEPHLYTLDEAAEQEDTIRRMEAGGVILWDLDARRPPADDR